jgi:hypothetical protein
MLDRKPSKAVPLGNATTRQGNEVAHFLRNMETNRNTVRPFSLKLRSFWEGVMIINLIVFDPAWEKV